MSGRLRVHRNDLLVYLAVRLVICILQALPFGLACRLMQWLAWLGYCVDRRHREVARDNLKHAFPDLTDTQQIDNLVRDVYRHFACVFAEMVHAPRLVHRENWRRFVDFRTRAEGERLVAAAFTGRPVLLATGHLGNWEVASHVFSLLGFRISVIARSLDNVYLDAYMRRLRQAQGQCVLNKVGDYDKIEAVLASGGILGTLADQDAGPKGLFVDFFNRPASTHKALALLALEHGVVIIVVAGIRSGAPLHYQVCVEDVIDPQDYQGRSDAARAITQRYMRALERLIVQSPEQYFWLHRRWKHEPPLRKQRVRTTSST